MKKTILTAFIFLAILLTACGGAGTPASTAEPETNEPSTVVAEGTLMPDPSVELSFAQPGIIAEVFVSDGERIEEGRVIARMENSEAMQAEVARAEEAYLLAEQAFNTSEARALKDLSDAHALLQDAQQDFDDFDIPSDLRQMGTSAALSYTYEKLEEARKNFEPYKYLEERLEHEMKDDDPKDPPIYRDTAKVYKKRLNDAWADYRKAIQWSELEASVEAAKKNVDNAQKEYDRLTAGGNSKELAVAQAQYESARANLEAARAALANVQLNAPVSGLLYSLDISVGETVNAGQPVAFLGDADNWLVETKDLAEIDVARVSIGDPVIIKLDAYPDVEFTGSVTEIDPVGREYLGDMTYTTTITLDETDPRFYWNMTATVTIDVK